MRLYGRTTDAEHRLRAAGFTVPSIHSRKDVCVSDAELVRLGVSDARRGKGACLQLVPDSKVIGLSDAAARDSPRIGWTACSMNLGQAALRKITDRSVERAVR